MNSRRYLLQLILLALGYTLLAKVSLDNFSQHAGNVSMVWPSSGLALAAILLGGIRYWPGVFVGALATSMLIGDSIVISFLTALGNTLEPLLGYWLLSSSKRFNRSLERPSDYFMLGFAGAISACLSTVIGVTSLWAAGIVPQTEIYAALYYWWVGDAAGIFLFAPMFLVWTTWPREWFAREKLFETIACFGLMTLVGQMVFLGWFADFLSMQAGGFWMFFFVTWIAVRFGLHGVTLMTSLVAAQSLLGIVHGKGYFAALSQSANLIDFWLYILTLSIVGTSLSMVIEVRKKAEKALGASEEKFRSIIEASPVSYALNDDNQNIVYLNAAFIRTFGYSHQDIPTLDDWWPKAYPDPDYRRWVATSWQERIDKVRQDGAEFEPMELNIRCKNGQVKTVMAEAVSLGDSYRGVHLVILYDITERKQAELAIHELALHTQAILDNMNDGVVTINEYGVMETFNKAACTIFGYTAEEVIGRNVSILMPEPHHGHHDSYLQHYRDTGEARMIGLPREVVGKRKDDSVFPMSLSVSQIARLGKATFIGLIRDLTQHREDEEKIRRLAYYDTLTALPNRRMLSDQLRRAMMTSRRTGKHGALMFLDMDNFKRINDSLGHNAGDELLKQVASRLIDSVREGDTIARLGGDEFVVLLEDLGEQALEAVTQAKAIAIKILEILGRMYTLDWQAYTCTPSIGIVMFTGDQEAIEDLLKKADVAMYQAKSAGRNTVRFFDPEMQAVAAARTEMENDLRSGLVNKEFVLHYQIQVNAVGETTGVEALVRWNHAAHGMVPPAKFIPLAEETGLILPLGQWVLETACTQLVEWARNPVTASWTMAVNVSALQFAQPDFVGSVVIALRKTGANPALLKLELTESMLVDDVEGIIIKMNHIKASGVTFSLDDFGTGYSSLAFIRRLPLDQLKIDQSFVRELLTDPHSAVIAHTIVSLGHSMGMKVIAEGVETAEQRDFLASIGCNAFQGYHFGRPGPANALLNG